METPRFCTNCGAPLEPGQLFCTNCGMRVEVDDATAPYPQAQPATGGTTPLEPIPSPQPEWAQQQDAHEKAGGSKTGVVVTIVVCCAAALVGCGLALRPVLFSHSESSQSTVAEEASSDETASTNKDSTSATGTSTSTTGTSTSSTSTGSDATTSSQASEADLRATLVGYYDALPSYDSRIKTVAADFNNNYLKDSQSLRQSYADTANQLLSELEARQDSLTSLTVPSGSTYRGQYDLLVQCYSDCVGRVRCIAQSWNIDVGYSDPTAHEDEILAPIRADNSGGTNKYKSDYDTTYPKISL